MDRTTPAPCLADQANDNRPQPALLPAAELPRMPRDRDAATQDAVRIDEEIQALRLLDMLSGAEEAAARESLQDRMMRKLFERERVMWAIAAILVSLTVLTLAIRRALD